MTQKLERQKLEKKLSLEDASYDLFLHKGFHKTSIDEIVKKANVAKGTFYLYFKDKSDVMEAVMLRLSCRLLSDAYHAMKQGGSGDFVEDFLRIVDYIIEYFKKNKLVLRMIRRDFSWPVIRDGMTGAASPEYREAGLILEECLNHPYFAGRSRDDIFKRLFIIIELCGSICYTSIINGQPACVDELKPFLYDIIRKILRP